VIVVADTSPLSYLVRIGCDTVLPRLYGSVAIPHAVLDELLHPKAPLVVRQWISSPPVWLRIESPLCAHRVEFQAIGIGEAEAIALAQQFDAQLLIDERLGSSIAVSLGVKVTGTLGVLVASHELGLLRLNDAIVRLFTQTNFRLSAKARAAFLEEHKISIDL
jgi:predicted nucleic acid-binding protein